LLDALAAVEGEAIELHVTDGNSSCLVRGEEKERTKYVVMPMRL
jgi:DNA polymerase-3 subunit beta